MKRHKPSFFKKVEDTYEEKNILAFNKMQTWHYVTHKQLHD